MPGVSCPPPSGISSREAPGVSSPVAFCAGSLFSTGFLLGGCLRQRGIQLHIDIIATFICAVPRHSASWLESETPGPSASRAPHECDDSSPVVLLLRGE